MVSGEGLLPGCRLLCSCHMVEGQRSSLRHPLDIIISQRPTPLFTLSHSGVGLNIGISGKINTSMVSSSISTGLSHLLSPSILHLRWINMLLFRKEEKGQGRLKNLLNITQLEFQPFSLPNSSELTGNNFQFSRPIADFEGTFT